MKTITFVIANVITLNSSKSIFSRMLTPAK